MTYVLIIFWWGSFAGQQTHIEFKSERTCNAALKELERLSYGSIDGNIKAWCTKK